MQTLESIYPEDYKSLEPADTHSFGKFSLKLYPYMDSQENFCNVEIEVKYKNSYPRVAPRVKITNT